MDSVKLEIFSMLNSVSLLLCQLNEHDLAVECNTLTKKIEDRLTLEFKDPSDIVDFTRRRLRKERG